MTKMTRIKTPQWHHNRTPQPTPQWNPTGPYRTLQDPIKTQFSEILRKCQKMSEILRKCQKFSEILRKCQNFPEMSEFPRNVRNCQNCQKCQVSPRTQCRWWPGPVPWCTTQYSTTTPYPTPRVPRTHPLSRQYGHPGQSRSQTPFTRLPLDTVGTLKYHFGQNYHFFMSRNGPVKTALFVEKAYLILL